MNQTLRLHKLSAWNFKSEIFLCNELENLKHSSSNVKPKICKICPCPNYVESVPYTKYKGLNLLWYGLIYTPLIWAGHFNTFLFPNLTCKNTSKVLYKIFHIWLSFVIFKVTRFRDFQSHKVSWFSKSQGFVILIFF
jgi:hypothetical protein